MLLIKHINSRFDKKYFVNIKNCLAIAFDNKYIVIVFDNNFFVTIEEGIHMKIQTGNPVRGDNYFMREHLIKKAWVMIESGNHILIAAPRRVGKTSLMYYLLDNPQDNYRLMYIITESVNNENEFYRKILNALLKTDHVKGSKKVVAFLESHIPNIKKIGPEGIEFGVKEDYDYFDILSRILKSISEENLKLIIMIDEFPETLENIVEDDGENAGRHFLQTNRELRQNLELSRAVQFIYTGSIGLENVVSRLNAVNTINDLDRLKLPPLTTDEAKRFISLLSANLQFQLSKAQIDYILQKIEWLIPFYIQLAISELRNLWRDESLHEINLQTIDRAFDQMLERRNQFEHWHTRLRTSFKGDEYNFVKEVLNILSENSEINSNEIHDLAVKHSQVVHYQDFIGSLVYDGYINNHDNPKEYRFNSPILKTWWRKNVAN